MTHTAITTDDVFEVCVGIVHHLQVVSMCLTPTLRLKARRGGRDVGSRATDRADEKCSSSRVFSQSRKVEDWKIEKSVESE